MNEDSGDPPVRIIEPPPTGIESDLHNAQALLTLLLPHHRVLAKEKQWIAYNADTGVWSMDDAWASVQRQVHRLANEAARQYAEAFAAESLVIPKGHKTSPVERWATALGTLRGVKNTSDTAMALDGAIIDPTEFNGPAPGVLALANATMYLPHRGDSRPFSTVAASAEDMRTFRAPWDYDPEAKCPRTLRFMSEIMNGDQEMVHFLQRLFGYAITGHCTEEIMPFLCGVGGTGRSTLMQLFRNVLGENYVKVLAANTLLDGSGRSPMGAIDIANMQGARIATVEEIEDKEINTAAVKRLTSAGKDGAHGYTVGKNFGTFKGEFVVIPPVNKGFKIKIEDRALERRFMLIPFDVLFSANDDTSLADTLYEESPGFLTWLIHGALWWAKDGLMIPHTVAEATKAHIIKSDIFGCFVADKYTILDEGQAVPEGMRIVGNTEMYKDYELWMVEQGEGKPQRQQDLTQYLQNRKGLKLRTCSGYKDWPRLVQPTVPPPPPVAR